MHIGIPKEVKLEEHRVSMPPLAVAELVSHGHPVSIQSGAGKGAGFNDEAYKRAGASLVADAKAVFAEAELIVKVKEPQPDEYALLRPEHTLFTYLHLAADRELTRALRDSGARCIAYETITDDQGGLPLLTPMSQIAGRLAVQAGATHLEKPRGGRGVLLSGATGVPSARVVIIGGGVVGRNACHIAMGMGADVCVIDRSLPQLDRLEREFGNNLTTVYASRENTTEQLLQADLVIGAVLIPGRSAERIITAEHVRNMRDGAVIVDVAIDQGGCCEHARPTTHADPTFIVDGVVHYCVANMPGAVPATASAALANATLPFILQLADEGVEQALDSNPHLQNGLNIANGKIQHPEVAHSLPELT